MIKLFSSIKLAVVLILALVLSSIIATFYPAINVFGSFWFRGLLLLFALNLFICPLKRIPPIFKQFSKKIEVSPQLTTMEVLTPQDTCNCEERLLKYFKSKRYKVQTKSEEEKIVFLAQKGFLNLIAPHFLHLALIVVLIGAFIGSFGSEGQIMGYVDQIITVPEDVANNISLKINDFQTLYDSQDAIDNWVSDMTLYVNGVEVKTGTTRVNKPFKYKGLVFYQSSYGYNHLVDILGEETGTFALPDGKAFKLGESFFNISHTKDGSLLKLFQGHQVMKAEILQQGEKFVFPDGTVFEYLKLQPYTVLNVKKDPGTPVVMLGFLLVTISSFLFWTGRYREVKVVWDKGEDNLYFKVNCKNKVIKSEIGEQIIDLLQ